MENTNQKQKIRYIVLLAAGFAGLIVSGINGLPWGTGLATAVWLFSFLYLTCDFRSKRELWLTAAVFCIGYLLKFAGAAGTFLLFLALFLPAGVILYGIFLGYSYLLSRWNRFYVTLAFPAIWIVIYLLATLLRLPSLVRVDIMYADMNVLLQTERLIGPAGLSFLVTWLTALIHFSVRNRRPWVAALSAALYFIAIVYGIVCLYPNRTATDSVRVAYTTGPYIGDFLSDGEASLETCHASMERSVRDAAKQGASILMFNEESFELNDTEESDFLEHCRKEAKENAIHVLVGLDVRDTDGSKGGKAINKIVWIDAAGEILGSYEKAKLIPGIEYEYAAGDGTIPSHVISVNGTDLKVSYLICYDSNFPSYVHGIDKDTDILFLPSWDWKAVADLHTKICLPLAVQNQVTLLKCTYDGVSIAVNPDGKIIHSTTTDEDGFEQVHVVDLPVKGQHGYEVTKEPIPGPTYGITAVEIMSFLICLTLLYGNIRENQEKTPRNRMYSILVFTTTVALAVDAGSWILDACFRLNSLLFLLTLLSMILTFVMTGEFIAYLTEYIRERQKISPILLRIYMVYTLLAVVLTVIASLNGSLFSYESGTYADGPLYAAYVVANVCAMAFCLLVTVAFRKSLSNHDKVAAYLYICIPGVAAVINLMVPEFSYAYPATTLSLGIIYVMIQSERANRLEREKQISSHYAAHDEMTGLFNRRAYNETLQTLQESNSTVGVIFADLNGLKYTNDNFGHAEGDRLICQFAELLSSCFRKEEIYRISGDEFTVILPGMKESTFEQRVEKLLSTLMIDGKEIACIGSRFGYSREVEELIKKAETQMYDRKEEFHTRHPEMSRT